MVQEKKMEGNIGLRDYMNLFSFSIGSTAIVIYFLIAIATSLIQLVPSFVLAKWTKMDLEEQQEATDYMWIFTGCVIGFMLLVFLRATVCQLFFLHASTNMHNTMAEKVLRANIIFFDSNPIGTITTRFSKDQTIIDMLLPVIVVLVT